MGQSCVWSNLYPALPQPWQDACEGRRFLSFELVDLPAPYCGLTSPGALAWVAKLNSLSAHCVTVVFTVITGGYDPLKPVPGGPQPGLCLVGLVDKKTADLQVSTGPER
ncbi:hypothetical protein T492DRAFT_862607 [Pavlovales sp. CCMP2436]|nr:hypothetical protein T492DRAFT_862607 [Pavlovales sp. CCMP2436]